jgi:hypothetical protein
MEKMISSDGLSKRVDKSRDFRKIRCSDYFRMITAIRYRSGKCRFATLRILKDKKA